MSTHPAATPIQADLFDPDGTPKMEMPEPPAVCVGCKHLQMILRYGAGYCFHPSVVQKSSIDGRAIPLWARAALEKPCQGLLWEPIS